MATILTSGWLALPFPPVSGGVSNLAMPATGDVIYSWQGSGGGFACSYFSGGAWSAVATCPSIGGNIIAISPLFGERALFFTSANQVGTFDFKSGGGSNNGSIPINWYSSNFPGAAGTDYTASSNFPMMLFFNNLPGLVWVGAEDVFGHPTFLGITIDTAQVRAILKTTDAEGDLFTIQNGCRLNVVGTATGIQSYAMLTRHRVWLSNNTANPPGSFGDVTALGGLFRGVGSGLVQWGPGAPNSGSAGFVAAYQTVAASGTIAPGTPYGPDAFINAYGNVNGASPPAVVVDGHSWCQPVISGGSDLSAVLRVPLNFSTGEAGVPLQINTPAGFTGSAGRLYSFGDVPVIVNATSMYAMIFGETGYTNYPVGNWTHVRIKS